MKKLALDIGDAWTGIALSDFLGITVRPYKTVASADLLKELHAIITTEKIGTIVIGYPATLRGTQSDQTRKVMAMADTIKEQFSTLECVFQYERFTSQQASRLSAKPRTIPTKETKLHQHAVAAALILQSYLDHLHTTSM